MSVGVGFFCVCCSCVLCYTKRCSRFMFMFMCELLVKNFLNLCDVTNAAHAAQSSKIHVYILFHLHVIRIFRQFPLTHSPRSLLLFLIPSRLNSNSSSHMATVFPMDIKLKILCAIYIYPTNTCGLGYIEMHSTDKCNIIIFLNDV